jgi:hypothetical protein
MCRMSCQSEFFAMKITSTILSINIFLGNVKSFILGDHDYFKHKHFEVLSDVLFPGTSSVIVESVLSFSDIIVMISGKVLQLLH